MKTRRKKKIIISRWKISTIIKWSSKRDTTTHEAYGNFSCGQMKNFNSNEQFSSSTHWWLVYFVFFCARFSAVKTDNFFLL
jgi:hypothetical protein